MFDQKTAWDMMYEKAHCWDEAVSDQLHIAAAFWTIQIVPSEGCSSIMQNLTQICCSTVMNVTVTHYTCSLNSVYCLHWQLQWSRLCSPMRMPVHSLWLPGYSDVVQTVLVMLTIVRLFFWTDYIHMCVYMCACVYACLCIYVYVYTHTQYKTMKNCP